MRTIGLIGGLSWESTAAYYEGLNKGVNAKLGGLHSAKIVLESLDFAELVELQNAERWQEAGELLAGAAQRLEAAGAELILICSSADHRYFDQVSAAVSVPLLHQADAIAAHAKATGLKAVGVIGSSLTMGATFFLERLAANGLEVDVPDDLHFETVDDIIYDELVHRVVDEESKKRVIGIIDELFDAGAEGVILGATELSLLVRPEDLPARDGKGIALFDAITSHVQAALLHAL